MKMWTISLLGLLACSRTVLSTLLPQEPLLESLSSSKHDIFAFHKNLTEIESITYNEQKAGEWLASSLKDHGYTVEKQWVDKKEGRFNIYAYPGDIRETEILLSSHYDTVRTLHITINTAISRSWC